ncbi:MAG: hypothetical protein OSJ58_04540 [Dysosmobacter sp.]|nr:hypothetical protein [uncultured Oscillibacter sp.]MCX4371084.1 hypothetical protein [Dysosmobacter sp.]
MKKSEFQQSLYSMFDQPVDGTSFDERMELIEKCFSEYQKNHDKERERPNYRKPWSDRELRIVLQSAPTVENCLRYAKLFGRGYGSIELIYRWASTADRDIPEDKADDVFIAHVKRIAKEVGWRAS